MREEKLRLLFHFVQIQELLIPSIVIITPASLHTIGIPMVSKGYNCFNGLGLNGPNRVKRNQKEKNDVRLHSNTKHLPA